MHRMKCEMDNLGKIQERALVSYVCKGLDKIHPALALCPPKFSVLPLLVYLSVNLTLLRKQRTFLMGASW
jgi:hypothetical protein